MISGFSSTSGANPVGATFTCTAPVAAGQFTVPAAVLLSLPASASTSGIPSGALTVGTYTNPKSFTATGLDYGYSISASLNSALVSYQ